MQYPPSIDACRACRLAKENDECGKMKGNGYVPGRYMVIGQNPSYRRFGKKGGVAPIDVEKIDWLSRQTSMDNASVALARVLIEVGWPIEQTYFTNELKCSTPNNRHPYRDEIEMCWDLWLSREIVAVKPRVLVCLGTATYQCVSEQCGGFIQVAKVFHHSYIAKRRPDLFKQWAEQWSYILYLDGFSRSGPEGAPTPPKQPS